MKQVPSALQLPEPTADGYRFRADGGALTLTERGERIVEVRYDFDAFPISAALEEAADLLYDAHRCDSHAHGHRGKGGDTLRERGEPVTTVFDRWGYRIAVTHSHGDVAISRGDTPIHGGRIGSADTVLPRFPLRVHGTGPNHVYGTFNVPLTADDRFFGLGDKTGGVDRRGRRFLMHNRDALGYRGRFADPLYKSIPFLIKENPATDSCVGIAFSAPDVVAIDLGVESEYYYSATVRGGPFRYVVFLGDSVTEVLERYTWLSGRPAFPPAFTFGFLGSSMDYSEPDDAAERIEAYLDSVEQRDIPCEGIYLSSGYYRARDGRRYTFEWNKGKFPDPRAFLGRIRRRGYHVAANIKPGILTTHPRFEAFRDRGTLLTNGDGSVYTEYYWGGEAGLWDFSTDVGRSTWREAVRRHILEVGVDGIWNDNNECEIEDSSLPAYPRRHTMSLLMNRVAWEESLRRYPDRRPWIVSRAGTMGMQRYARTWSGDNASTWESLYYNTVMGSSFGLSGMPFFGHDIGGFFGPRPDAEQFLRWCQSAVFQPRFVIHSWNEDGRPTELWSYEELADDLRRLVLQHYEYMPYTYSLAWRAHRRGTPIQRHPYVEYPHDPAMRSDDTMYLYGEGMLVSLPLEAGLTSARYRLPAPHRWYDPADDTLYHGGVTVAKEVPRDRVPYLVREGSIIPRAPGARSLERGIFPQLMIDIYPGPVTTTFELFEDDGLSRADLGRWSTTAFDLQPTGEGRWVLLSRTTDDNGWEVPGDQRVTVQIPPGFAFGKGRDRKRVFTRRAMRAGIREEIAGAYRREVHHA